MRLLVSFILAVGLSSFAGCSKKTESTMDNVQEVQGSAEELKTDVEKAVDMDNPCAAATNPCAANPCGATANPCAANPCGATTNPCAANPCGATANPCGGGQE